MKESKAVYVTRHKIRGDQRIVYQLGTYWDREYRRFENYNKNNDFACQFDSKKDACTCRNVYRRDEMYFSKVPKQVYAYQRSRSFTDIGVGSVKALQRRKVKRVYLPETDDRGVGSSDLSAYTIRRTRPYKDSYYNHKETSSKCVGGIIEYNTGCVISEKLSPIINTKSGTTSPKILEGQNIEIGSNTIVKKVATVGTQFEIDNKEGKVTPKKQEPKLEATSSKVCKPKQKYIKPDSSKKLERKIKDAERQFSSDSLLQHIHELDIPSEDKPSRTSLDPMENKLEREYRRMFATKDKDSKPSCDKPIPEFKSASILRRRFEALRRGLTKKDDLKKSSFIPKSSQSRESTPSRKDASVTSDPPSLEGRSYSNTKRYSPIQANIIEQERPRMNYKNERDSMQYSTEIDSDCQGVRGMFKLWGKKFNLEEDSYHKKQSTPKPSYDAPKKTEKGMEKRENQKKKPKPETKKEKRFFFFKKKAKEKTKDPYYKQATKKAENVTAGRCEITEGLTLKLNRPSTPAPVPKEKTSKASQESEEITRKRWLRRFLSNTIESARSVNVRWNNTAYATSSSTVFEIIDTIYKNTEIFITSHSEVTSLESYYAPNTKKVNFTKDFEAWMIPKMIPDRPKEIPVKICSKKDVPKKNIELSYFNQKWLIDQSKALSHKIEVVLHSKNLNVRRNVSSEYLRIDIPKDFFDDLSSGESKCNQTSDEEVYKIVEYESDSESKKVIKNIRMEKGDDPQSDIKVIVSVQDSKNLESKILETVIKRPPTHRDVIIQGSNVNIPKRCDVIGVGIITQRDLREMRKPILKIKDVSSSDDSNPPPLLNQKKCEFAESYLQEYYKHWTPLGLDLYSCVSDSHLKSCSEKSLSFHNQQGDGSKSCPNMCDDYQASAIISSCETSSGSAYNKKKDNISKKMFGFMKKKEKNPDDSGKRVLPKDSLEVFKKRKIYAHSNKSQWICGEDKPVSVPSFESRGEQDYKDSRGGQACHNDDCPKIQRPVLMAPYKKKDCKKHVSMPDCERMSTELNKQLAERIEGILTFKGGVGCETCKRKIVTPPKHATIRSKPSIEIPDPPCKVTCIKESNPACLRPGSPSCNIPSRDILCPPPRPKPGVCPESPLSRSPARSKCSTPPSCPPSPPKCSHPPKRLPSCSHPVSPPKPCPTSPCPSPPKKTKPRCPYSEHGTESLQSRGNGQPCSAMKRGSHGVKQPCPSMIPLCPKQMHDPLPPPPCPASLPSCQRPSQPTIPGLNLSNKGSTTLQQCPPKPCSSSPKTSKHKCPYATESSPSEANSPPRAAMKPDRHGVQPPCLSMVPPCPNKMPKPLSPPPCPESLPTCQKSSRPIIPGLNLLNKCSTPKISKKKGLYPHCAATEKAEKSASYSSCRGCMSPKKIMSKKTEYSCSTPQTLETSACPSTNQGSQCLLPQASNECNKSSQKSSSGSPVPCAGPMSPGISLTSCLHPPKPKPPKPPKLSPCHQPPCSKIETKPNKVDCKKSVSKQTGCGQESPWPRKSQCPNQPPPKTSEGCLSKLGKLIDKIKNDKSECKKDCSMMETIPDCFQDPTPEKEDFKPQCPSKLKVANPDCEENRKRFSGLFLRKNPSKKKTCSKECSAWESEPLEPGIVRLNSREKITIKLKQSTPSTEEIREGMNIKVQDEDGRTLYERKDYGCSKNRSSVCGNIYDAKLNRISTPGTVTKLASETQQDISNTKSEQSFSNQVEIQFKLRIIHGDKTTEINIGKEEDQDELKGAIENTPEVYSVKNDEREEITDEADPKNDISIKIMVKNYKLKSDKRQSNKEKQDADDFCDKISHKFNTVSTGYSGIFVEPEDENENVFSVHRATINLASSTEKSKIDSAASNERSKTHSAVSNDVEESLEPIEQEPSNTKSKTSYTVPSLSTEELAIITEDEAPDNPKSNVQAYDTHYEYLRETYSNYFNKARALKLQKEQETTDPIKSEEKVEPKSKESSKLTKKELLKKVFQRAHSKPKSKGRVRQLREMLKIILTDSSTNEDLTITSNELAKDVTYTSFEPNYFKDSDSMNNYYKIENAESSLKSKTSLLEPNNHPTQENSDETEEDLGQASPPYRGCMCSKVAEKIKDPSLNISCCCRKKPKEDIEVNCDLYEEFNEIISIDTETQRSTVPSKVNSKKSTDITGTVITKIKEVTTNKIERILSLSKQDNQIDKHTNNDKATLNYEINNEKLKKDKTLESKDKEKRKKYNYSNAADILQCYETKKAVLEIYAEKTYSEDGEHLVAKLPKFLYDKENEIERNFITIRSPQIVT